MGISRSRLINRAVLLTTLTLGACSIAAPSAREAEKQIRRIAGEAAALRRADAAKSSQAELQRLELGLDRARVSLRRGSPGAAAAQLELAELELALARDLVKLAKLRATTDSLQSQLARTEATVKETRSRLQERRQYLYLVRQAR